MTQISNYSDLHSKIKSLWQFGDWNALTAISIPEEIQSPELLPYKIAALYQLGLIDEGRQLQASLTKSDKYLLTQLLISGVYNCLAKINSLINDHEKSNNFFSTALLIIGSNELSVPLEKIRKAEQLSQISKFERWTSFSNTETLSKKRKLFIDCGGHDGCSAIKFLLSHPDYDAITFEANPELWKYYDKIPTHLIKKAVYDYDGEIEFTIDPVDADGSSLIKGKKIDYYGNVKNDDCPKIKITCVDLSIFIKNQSSRYEEIVLKLDVEGAEYAILNKMLNDKTIILVKKLYAEFHWHKIGLERKKHESLIEELEKYVEIEHWDAHDFSIHRKDKYAEKRRDVFISALIS